VAIPDAGSLLARLPLFRKMRRSQREALKLSELASHLSALADGERRAVTLAGDSVLLCSEDEAEQRWFLGTLLADEAKHFLTLRRYLKTQLNRDTEAHPALAQVFAELALERDFALNLLVGQVVLEGAAASLLTSLLITIREPLLQNLLRRISRDEARHMKFAHAVNRTPADKLPPARRRRMEEVLFEAAWAAAASLFAEPTWREFEIDRTDARQATVEGLRERGVIHFYTRVVGRHLAQRGFPADHLARTVERHLEHRLLEMM
jgi:hypothetical protein